MNDFKKILANIEHELAELKEINEALVKENSKLRFEIGKSAVSTSDFENLSIALVFDQIEFKDGKKHGGLILRASNSLLRAGIYTLYDLKYKSLTDLKRIKGSGNSVLAIILCVAQKYGMEYQNLDSDLVNRIKDFKKRLLFKN